MQIWSLLVLLLFPLCKGGYILSDESSLYERSVTITFDSSVYHFWIDDTTGTILGSRYIVLVNSSSSITYSLVSSASSIDLSSDVSGGSNCSFGIAADYTYDPLEEYTAEFTLVLSFSCLFNNEITLYTQLLELNHIFFGFV